MNQQRKRIFLFVALTLIIISGILSIRSYTIEIEHATKAEPKIVTDLSDIIERGYLRAATDYNTTNYFVYRGEPMGFHLELLKIFANHIGVELEIQVSNDLAANINCVLEEDGCDIIAANLTVTNSRRRILQFTEPHSQTRQMLVQRKPSGWSQMTTNDVEKQLVRSPLDLAGKTIHVQRHSAFVSRLNHIMEEIGDTIYVVECDDNVERLIERVARGEIAFTVSDEQLARLHQFYHSEIDVNTPVGFTQNLAWVVRPEAVDLLAAVNEWMTEFKSSRQYAEIYNKYYNNPRSVFMARSQLHSLGGGMISLYDEYFKRYSEIVGWDWRLIASLSYQESRFNPTAESWAGAYGIMQLMPGTAEFLNVGIDASVQEHINGGIRYLKWLDRRLSNTIEDDDERIKFVLASYNVGLGHVLDARRLAEKYGKDPNVWRDNVDYFILNKSNPKYYNDPVVRHGFARGAEPYNYVMEILDRYRHYRNTLDLLAHRDQ